MGIIQIILLQIYWLSFSFIGLAAFLLLRNFSSLRRFTRFGKASLVLMFLFITGLGMATMLPYVVPAFFLKLPVLGLKIYYLLLLVISSVVLIRNREICLKFAINSITGFRATILSSFAFVVIGMSLISSLAAGGLIDGDAMTHISFINQWLSTGNFSLSDPYFGWNGVLNISYSTNLHFSLLAVAADIFNISAVNSWFYSNALYALLVWLSFYALCRAYLPEKRHLSWAYAIMGLIPIIFQGSLFDNASLPATTAIIWTVLLLIGIKVYIEQKNSLLLILASLLLVTTHSFSSAMAALFLMFYVSLLVLTKNISRSQLLVFGVLIGLLLIPAAVASIFPRYIPNIGTGGAYTVGEFLGHNFKIVAIPHHYALYKYIVLCCLLACFFMLHKVKAIADRRLLTIFYLLIGITILLAYNRYLIGLIGFFYVTYYAKDRRIRLIIVALVLNYSLIAYNPLITQYIIRVLPHWALLRIADFNLLHFVAPIIGLFFIVQFSFEKLKIRHSAQRAAMLGVLLTLTVIPFIEGANIRTPRSVGSIGIIQTKQKLRLNKVQRMKSLINENVIYSNDQNILSSIPNIVAANFVSLPNEGPSPLANIFQRNKCYYKLKNTLLESDLADSKVGIVLSYVVKDDTFDRLASSKPYLQYIQQVDEYKIYKFTGKAQQTPNPPSVCLFNRAQ